MKVEESPFKTTLMGHPIEPRVLRHNAYVAGWEHGATDHRPQVEYWDTMHSLGLIDLYQQGREDGRAARETAFARARVVRDRTDHESPPR